MVSNGPATFKIWQHEFGVDEIDGAQINAVESFFETGDIALIISDPPKNRSIHVEMMEPDFVQAGDMTVQITGRINARAPEINGPLRTFPAVPAEKYEQQVFPVFVKHGWRQLSNGPSYRAYRSSRRAVSELIWQRSSQPRLTRVSSITWWSGLTLCSPPSRTSAWLCV